MKTTWKELKDMIEAEGINDSTQIILQVRGNSTTDYSEQRVVVEIDSDFNLIIKDNL